MIWKRYQKEIMVAGALLFAFASFIYKSVQHSSMAMENQRMVQEVAALEETVSLQKIWGDKRIVQKLESVKKMIPSSKIKWTKQGKKLTMELHGLRPSELNNVVTKLLNIPIQIKRMKIEKKNDTYDMEFACKW